MNDGSISPELQRTAAVARITAAKDRFTKAAVGFLRGDPDAEGQVSGSLAELNAARADLRRLDGAE